MCICLRACMHVRKYVCLPACMHVRKYVCMCVCMYRPLHVCIRISIYRMCVCMYVQACMYTCVHACMHTYVRAYVHAYIHHHAPLFTCLHLHAGMQCMHAFREIATILARYALFGASVRAPSSGRQRYDCRSRLGYPSEFSFDCSTVTTSYGSV